MGLNGEQEDAVCIGGWNLDEHPSLGFDGGEQKVPPFVTIRLPDVYNIPYRCLYSKNVKNLLMAGRNISASHVAFYIDTRDGDMCRTRSSRWHCRRALCTSQSPTASTV